MTNDTIPEETLTGLASADSELLLTSANKTEPAPEYAKPTRKSAAGNFVLRKMPVTDGQRKTAIGAVPMPSEMPNVLMDAYNSTPIINPGASGEGTRWREVTEVCADFITVRPKVAETHFFEEPLAEDGGNWQQGVVAPDNQLHGSRRLGVGEKSNIGELATMMAVAMVGGGKPFLIALPNSFFWVTLKTPAEEAILNLLDEVRTDTVQAGRYTYGMAMANTAGMTLEKVAYFFVKHIYSSTLNFGSLKRDELLGMIDLADAWNLFLAILATRNPLGIATERPCVASPGTCTAVHEGTLDFQWVQLIANHRMTQEQRAFMSVKTYSAHSPDAVRTMQKNYRDSIPKRLDVEGGNGVSIGFNLRFPSVLDSISETKEWINDISEGMVSVVSEDEAGNARNTRMVTRTKATNMRQYTHYVESIDLGDGNVITDRVTVRKTLSAISTNEAVRSGFTKGIKAFIESTTLSIAGIPNYICPVCRTKQEGAAKDTDFESVLPLDIPRLFFELLFREWGSIEAI